MYTISKDASGDKMRGKRARMRPCELRDKKRLTLVVIFNFYENR